MARSEIEWLARPGTIPESWNLVGGCAKKSPGCANCYAIRQSWMKMHHPNPKVRELYEGTVHKVNDRLEWTGRINLASSRRLSQPLKWRKPRTVFVCSMGDLFHEDVPVSYIDRVFAQIVRWPQHTFLILTKRARRMYDYFYGENALDYCGCERKRHIWLCVTTENQQAADERIPLLLQTPAAMRFVSVEPMLGAVDLSPYLPQVCPVHLMVHRNGRNCLYPDQTCIDWIIVGGESGPGARPTHPDDFRNLRDQCQAAEVPFFFKQWGAWLPNAVEYGCYQPEANYNRPHKLIGGTNLPDVAMVRVGKKAAGRLLDGEEWNQWPT
jgi:protein gp37